MNYALCSPLLSHMPTMKLCPMTTMHLLPPHAYFIHDHLDILSATTILWPHLFKPLRIWQIRCPEQLRRLVTSRTSTPMILDVIPIIGISISDSGPSSVVTKNHPEPPTIMSTPTSAKPDTLVIRCIWRLTIWIHYHEILSGFCTNSNSQFPC